MKYIFLLLFILFSYEYAFSQQDTSVIMQLSLPQKTKQLSTGQLNTLKNKRSKSKISLERFGNHVYRKDSLLICYFFTSYPPDVPGFPSDVLSLEDVQKDVLGVMHRLNPNMVDASEITVINNLRFLIIEFHEQDDTYYLRFTSDHNKNLRYIYGLIEFKKPDEEKAWSYLNEFLHSMHFKEK